MILWFGKEVGKDHGRAMIWAGVTVDVDRG